MQPQQFRAVITAGPRKHAVIAVPFDPDEEWGAKADHPVGGTIEASASAAGYRQPATDGC
ncbi:hypothetical protein AMES_3713 [Amycolatopsis mediterranei S699]|uniref:Uncharacterized protein n=2 Tax=Amycolatopsis mediterranei TaxID=33910 RepID=A0A0H3D5I1_AMYMU|nr:hypothetical protein [Amycolatopsis mediterranei]ADJ45537.1 hypothetical protein AMED_3758 [Amycolatopsis mediterranei U32]AEK42313.1 hypothetical protein RAM_19135 [Amycolatopsis mediterranei S699]AFO77249.1 hypothetical protein AMES_3713 [Amycolatopsis mediterranei S699]AGT84377.1 hypothetical protein B737_3713 [Amycolatopsis mediterranei RB]KDO05795.1 hypothetical protein DV26_36145 [Amycolatopsis mediterranei]